MKVKTIKKSASEKTVAKSAKTAKAVKTAKKATAVKSARKPKAKKPVAKALKVGMISEAEIITSGYGGCKAELPGGEVVWIPASQTSWTRPVSVPEIGENVRVKLIEKNEQGFKASMKVLVPDPFSQKFCLIHDIGDVLSATVRSANITGVSLEFDIPGVYGSLVAGEVGTLLKAGGLPPVGSEIKVKIEEFHEPTRNVRVSLVEIPEVLEKPSLGSGWRAFVSGDPSAGGTGKDPLHSLGLSGGDYGQSPKAGYIVADAPNFIWTMLTDRQRGNVLPAFARAVEKQGSHPVLYITGRTLGKLKSKYPKAYVKVNKFCEQNHDKVVKVLSGCDDDEEILAFLASHENAIAVSNDGYSEYLDRYGEIIRSRVVPWANVLCIPGSKDKVRIPKLGIEFEI